jgi:ADP-heptose:LPS heptosyltransferase
VSEFGVERIAVLRATALGDFVFCMPALLALRAAYPRAEICLLGRPWHASFLRDRPGPVDRVIVVPPSRGVREEPGAAEDPRELDGFFARMRAERFDVALQMHGGGRWSNPFATRGRGRGPRGGRAVHGCRPLCRGRVERHRSAAPGGRRRRTDRRHLLDRQPREQWTPRPRAPVGAVLEAPLELANGSAP